MEMPGVALKYILEASFRSNPAYELVLFDRLPQAERTALANLRRDPEFYGILRPRKQGLETKSVCRDTALLFLTIQAAGKLPGYVTEMLGNGTNEEVAKLVLDQILEIECAGSFLSGAAAYELICEVQHEASSDGVLERLSIEALKYGQVLELSESSSLSTRLYLYNRLPVSPYWKRLFPSEHALAEHLGLQKGGQNQDVLEQHWINVPPPPDNSGWRIWRSRYVGQAGAGHRIYKLYVSPQCGHLQDAFGVTIDVLTDLQAHAFKVGRDIYDILRPDKLVAYFPDFKKLHEAADRLSRGLAGMPAHGVPFTSGIDERGLLSWGMDPPQSERLFAWQGSSWRRWITDRLAVALITAKATPSQRLEPWQFALNRLRFAGIDTTTWTPTMAIWDEAGKED